MPQGNIIIFSTNSYFKIPRLLSQFILMIWTAKARHDWKSHKNIYIGSWMLFYFTLRGTYSIVGCRNDSVNNNNIVREKF